MNETIKTFIIKYDSSAAFGNCLFKINRPEIPEGTTISRISAQIGPLTKSYDNPSFPIKVQLTKQESAQLDHENPVNILVFDGDGNPQTAIMKTRYVVVAGERKVYDDGGYSSD